MLRWKLIFPVELSCCVSSQVYVMSNDQTRDCQKRLSLGQTPNDNVIGIEGGNMWLQTAQGNNEYVTLNRSQMQV